MGWPQGHSGSDVPALSGGEQVALSVDLPSVLRPHVDRFGDRDPLLIVVNDPQRHTDTGGVLRALRRVQVDIGGRCHILVACGTHQFAPHTQRTFERGLAEAAGGVQSIVWHDCRDAALTPVGCSGRWRCHPLLTAGQTPVLVIGSVEPHYFAGLTGAHKTVTIGCADRVAIEANHAGAMSAAAQPFALRGNPVFDGIAAMLADLEHVRPMIAVDLVQSGSTLCAAAAGAPMAALEQVRTVAEDRFSHAVDRAADALVLEVAGPLAASFYQADKAIKNTEDAVRDGGLLILQAACPDGIGQDHFVSLLREAPTYEQAVSIVADRGYRLGDHKAVRLRRLTDPATRGVRIAAVSEGLTVDDCAAMGMAKFASVSEALAANGVRPGVDRVFAVSDAGNTVVRVAAAGED